MTDDALLDQRIGAKAARLHRKPQTALNKIAALIADSIAQDKP